MCIDASKILVIQLSDALYRRSALPRVVHSWLRNWVACMALYFGISGAWVYYAYWVFGSLLYKPGYIPPADAVTEQASVRFLPGLALDSDQQAGMQ